MVRPERFELPTFWFVARRSIQLSYGRKFVGLLPIYRVGWYSASTAISRIRRPTCVAHKATYCHARTQMLSVPLSLRRATFVKGLRKAELQLRRCLLQRSMRSCNLLRHVIRESAWTYAVARLQRKDRTPEWLSQLCYTVVMKTKGDPEFRRMWCVAAPLSHSAPGHRRTLAIQSDSPSKKRID